MLVVLLNEDGTSYPVAKRTQPIAWRSVPFFFRTFTGLRHSMPVVGSSLLAVSCVNFHTPDR